MPSWGVPHHTRLRAADAVARHDPGGLLYGAVVTAGSLAAVSINVAHAHRVALGVITVLVALAIHGFVVLPLWVRIMGGMGPRTFFRGTQEATLTAFATASSTAFPVSAR